MEQVVPLVLVNIWVLLQYIVHYKVLILLEVLTLLRYIYSFNPFVISSLRTTILAFLVISELDILLQFLESRVTVLIRYQVNHIKALSKWKLIVKFSFLNNGMSIAFIERISLPYYTFKYLFKYKTSLRKGHGT